jgi:hypothetical protein
MWMKTLRMFKCYLMMMYMLRHIVKMRIDECLNAVRMMLDIMQSN